MRGGALAVLCLAVTLVRGEAKGGCQFNTSWSGLWFQSGIQQLVNITSDSIETKGVCVESSGDKFIMEDKHDNCYRCIFITENHPNVLQYKETYCGDRDSLENMCNLISGDANLYLMFRDVPLDGPEPCPFKGAPFTFTYSRGAGECSLPVSRIDSCIQDSRLRIHYQACPDVGGTESTVEELTCLASWKDGSVRYLIGKINGQRTSSDEDRYRCFVYERHNHDNRTGYSVAQSGEATCSGLSSSTEGSRTMLLTKVDTQHPRCRFPLWATEHHTWHALDSSSTFHFTQKNATMRITHVDNSSREMRVVCHSLESNGEGVRLVAHATRGCDSGYICMVFYRRDGHVMELQQSNVMAQVSEEACGPQVFDHMATPFTTLITTSLRGRKCPYLGRYSLAGGSPTRRGRGTDDAPAECDSRRYRNLVVGCSDSPDKMEFHSACEDKEPDSFSCHANWEVNGKRYVIASPASRSSVSARRYCFIFSHKETGSNDKHRSPEQLTSVTDSCHRHLAGPESRGIFHYNLTMSGECAQASMGAVSTTAIVLPSVFFILLLVVTLGNVR